MSQRVRDLHYERRAQTRLICRGRAVVTTGNVGTTAVGSGGKLAQWLETSGLVKVQHHGRLLVRKVMAGNGKTEKLRERGSFVSGLQGK